MPLDADCRPDRNGAGETVLGVAAGPRGVGGQIAEEEGAE